MTSVLRLDTADAISETLDFLVLSLPARERQLFILCLQRPFIPSCFHNVSKAWELATIMGKAGAPQRPG
jgi:hypothetical protein